jgi:hypothetical protein
MGVNRQRKTEAVAGRSRDHRLKANGVHRSLSHQRAFECHWAGSARRSKWAKTRGCPANFHLATLTC